jgi:hypothetical protein
MYFNWKKKSNGRSNFSYSTITSGGAWTCTFNHDGVKFISIFYPRCNYLEVKDANDDHLWSYDMDNGSTLDDADSLVNDWVNDDIQFNSEY